MDGYDVEFWTLVSASVAPEEYKDYLLFSTAFVCRDGESVVSVFACGSFPGLCSIPAPVRMSLPPSASFRATEPHSFP